jgi:dual specificity protein kinase YAK1
LSSQIFFFFFSTPFFSKRLQPLSQYEEVRFNSTLHSPSTAMSDDSSHYNSPPAPHFNVQRKPVGSNTPTGMLQRSSFGSTSSLMSFDDPKNSMYSGGSPAHTQQQQQQQQPQQHLKAGQLASSSSSTSSSRLHYNPHASPRLQTSASQVLPDQYNSNNNNNNNNTNNLAQHRLMKQVSHSHLPQQQDHDVFARHYQQQQPLQQQTHLGVPDQQQTYSHQFQIAPARRSMVHHNSTSQITHPFLNASPLAPLLVSYPATYAPSFKSIHSKAELTPMFNAVPNYRRALPEGGFLSPLQALTKHLSTTYHICNPTFNYQSSKNPKRILTKPGEGKLNNGFDNENSDYILFVNDILGVEEQRRYLVLDVLGQGTFGQVVKCQNMINKEIVAVKVIKNKPAYLKQSMMEVSILDHLNNQVDKNNQHNLLRLKDRFMHKEHLCLVFELLSSNLYELIKRNKFRGLSVNLVRVFTQQLLDSLKVLKEAKLIHCDLKPENILLKSLDNPQIKVIDFGSACHELQTVYTYIQSRFYRSPEILLGLPYTTSIDMWSLGCIVVELFLGLPIFPGTSEYNQLSRIIDTLGNPPNWMIEKGKNSGQFMEKYVDHMGNKHYKLKSREKFSAEFKVDEKPSKQYFPSTKLDQIIMNYPLPRSNMKPAEVEAEMHSRASLLNFVQGLLNMNPFERWTPHQAAMHPFITESKYAGPFVPSMAVKQFQQPQQQQQQPTIQQYQTHQQPQQQPASQRVNSNWYQPSNQQQQQNQQQSQPQQQQQQQQQQHSQPPKIQKPAIPSITVQADSLDQSQKHNMYYGNTIPQMPPKLIVSNVPSLNSKPPYPTEHTMPSHIPPQPQQQQQQQQPHHQQQTLGTGWSTRRPRASTIGNMARVPPPIQRATALMNPAQPIRAQPSPAYLPPPEMINNAGQNHNDEAIRHLEDGLKNNWR